MAITLTKDWQVIASHNWKPGTGFNFTVYLEARYTSQSQKSNYSKLLTRLRSVVHAGSGSGYNYGFSCSYCNSISSSSIWYFANETILESSEQTIYHDNNGSKKLTLSASGYVNGVGFSFNISNEVAFPKIDRIPTISNITNITDEENPVITFTNPANFYLKAHLYTLGGYEFTRKDITSPYTFTLTDEERNTIRTYMKDKKTDSNVFLTIEAYSSSDFSSKSLIGEETKSFTISIVNAEPTFTSAFEETDENVINILGSSTNKIVKNASKVKTTINPTALKGATIKSVEIIHGTSDVILTASPYEQTLTALTNTFKVVVTDSRGYVVSDEITKDLIDYLPIEISQYSFKRVNPTSSDIKLNATIKYMQQTFNTTKNTPILQWKMGADGELNTISSDDYSIDTANNEITISDLLLEDLLPYTEQEKFYLLVNDLLTSDAENQLVIVGIPVFDYGEHDLQVNGDLYIADRNRQNPMNVKDLVVDSLEDNSTTKAPSQRAVKEINEYSLEETIIGIYFGKTLYRKCYKVNSFPNAGKTYLNAEVNNIEEVIFAGGFAKTSNETIFLQSAYDGTHHDAIVYEPLGNQIRLRASSDRTGYSGCVWIEYTKTTD